MAMKVVLEFEDRWWVGRERGGGGAIMLRSIEVCVYDIDF